MTKEKRKIEKTDLAPVEIYSQNRKKYRKELVEFKKNRRVAIGPYATFYFESFETMLGQVQEMIHIEKGGEEQLIDLFFDPTGYTLDKGTLYLSGLSFGFGLSDKLHGLPHKLRPAARLCPERTGNRRFVAPPGARALNRIQPGRSP